MKLSNFWNSFNAISYGSKRMGTVVYIDLARPGFQFFPEEFGLPLIFSGVSLGNRVSTINSAEDIIKKISAQERINPCKRVFYDLQTAKGYPLLKKGEFILNKLYLKKNKRELSVEKWSEVKKVPENFSYIFLCLLGNAAAVNLA